MKPFEIFEKEVYNTNPHLKGKIQRESYYNPEFMKEGKVQVVCPLCEEKKTVFKTALRCKNGWNSCKPCMLKSHIKGVEFFKKEILKKNPGMNNYIIWESFTGMTFPIKYHCPQCGKELSYNKAYVLVKKGKMMYCKKCAIQKYYQTTPRTTAEEFKEKIAKRNPVMLDRINYSTFTTVNNRIECRCSICNKTMYPLAIALYSKENHRRTPQTMCYACQKADTVARNKAGEKKYNYQDGIYTAEELCGKYAPNLPVQTFKDRVLRGASIQDALNSYYRGEEHKLSFEDAKARLAEKTNNVYILLDYKGYGENCSFECTVCKKQSEGNYGALLIGTSSCKNPLCSMHNTPTVSRGVRKISTVLNDKGVAFTIEKTYDDLRAIGSLRYDFFIGERNSIIEFDGIQHFKPSFWGKVKDILTKRQEALEKLKKTHRHDMMKNAYCERNKIPLLRIRYDQVHLVEELIDDLFENPDKYVERHNKILSNEEYYATFFESIEKYKKYKKEYKAPEVSILAASFA